jgi:hypothetical protein
MRIPIRKLIFDEQVFQLRARGIGFSSRRGDGSGEATNGAFAWFQFDDGRSSGRIHHFDVVGCVQIAEEVPAESAGHLAEIDSRRGCRGGLDTFDVTRSGDVEFGAGGERSGDGCNVAFSECEGCGDCKFLSHRVWLGGRSKGESFGSPR